MIAWLRRLFGASRTPWPPHESTSSNSPADPQDTAFIALGAGAVWAASDISVARRFDGGWVEFIDAAIDFAPLVSAASDRYSDAPFVWAYHVATPFGRWVGGALLDAGRPGGVTRAEAALALEGVIQRAFEWSGN